MLEESFYAEMTDLSSVRDICPKVLSEKTIPIKIILHFWNPLQIQIKLRRQTNFTPLI